MRGIFVVMVAVVSVSMATVEPSLPSWNEMEREEMIEKGWMAGGILLDFDSLPEEEKEPETVLEGVDAKVEEMGPEEDPNEIEEKYLADYFANKSSRYLVDPQGLLGDRDRRDMEAFLEYQSIDSSIAMYVYLFGADQEIPSDVREEEIVERLYSVGKPAVVIYYYLGAPQRASVYLSPVVTDVVSATEQSRALESAVVKAFGHTEVLDQLEAFLVQMSIRIYWMERMTSGTASETRENKPGEQVGKILRGAEEIEDTLTMKLKPWLGVSASALVAGGGFVMVVWSLVMFLRMKRRNVFPEFDVEPRLGGNHAAGVGAVISFSNPMVSPASQRDQMPGYVRRA